MAWQGQAGDTGRGEGPWEGARLDPPHPWWPMEWGMKGRRPWLSLACGCCCGDTGSTSALPISHSFPLSHTFTPQMLSCPVPARPSPTAAAPGTASPHPAQPGWLGHCAPAFLLPVPFPCLQPGGNHPHLEHPSRRSRELWQEPTSGGGWRGPAPGAAAAPPAALSGAGGAP